MKTTSPQPPATHRRRPPGTGRRQAAFTMVEIAISIAVVGIALVAIIGILPSGFDVQTRNRQNTLINQEGSFWVEALRSGAQGLDYLTNYVDLISVNNFDAAGGNVPPPRVFGFGKNGYLDGRDIIGLLTQPPYYPRNTSRYLYYPKVTAFVRALTGSAGEKAPANDFAFSYRLTAQLVPFQAFGLGLTNPIALTNFTAPNLTPAESQARLNRYELARRAQNLQAGTYELRLALEWPVYKMGNQVQVGNNRKTFRTLVNATLQSTNDSRLGRMGWLQSRELISSP